jgi:FkbM family methyltransferase
MKSELISKTFIDLGAFNGDTIELALRFIPGIKQVFAFEPLNSAFLDLEKRFINRKNFTLINAAADLSDGKDKIFIGEEHGDIASSMFSINRNCYQDQFEIVETIDFPSFVTANIERRIKEEVILKMNIEGSEYKLLGKMIEDESIKLIDKIYIDWHWSFIDVSEEDHFLMVKKLRSLGFDVCGGKLDELYNASRYNRSLLKLLKFKEYTLYSLKLSIKHRLPYVFNLLKSVKSRITGH